VILYKGRAKLYNLWLAIRWHLDPTVTPGSIVAWWQCVCWWWGQRPRRVRCEFCGTPIWLNGPPEAPVYCNENCAMYGPAVLIGQIQDGEIPF